MEEWVTAVELDRLEVRAVQTGRHADAARELWDLAQRVGRGSEIPRVELLIRAGEQWEIAEEYEHALAAYRAARADGGSATVDPRALQIGPLLQLGSTAAAENLLRGLRRDGVRNLPTCIAVVEALYAHQQLYAAREWATAGARRFGAYDIPGYVHELLVSLLRIRFRVGADLGLPEDELDRLLDAQ